MIFEDCLAQAVADEKISQKTADKYTKYFRDAEKEAAQLGKAGVDGYTFATSKAAERMMNEIGRSKAAMASDILRVQRAIEDVESHTKGTFRGLQAKLGENVRGGGVAEGLWAQQRAAYATMQAGLTDFIAQLRSKAWGLTRDVAHPRDVVRELYGQDSGVASAKVNAQAWQKANEWWTGMMDNEKVHIAKREDWFLPQQFNSLKVRIMGQDGFVDAMMQRWQDGRLRLRDWNSSSDAVLQPGVDDARVREILGGTDQKPGAWRNITTHGDASIEPGISVKDSMADRYNRRRVFEWTTPEAYFDFLDTFGNGSQNLGDQFMRHLHQQSKDLGTARVLGGDPDRTAKTLMQYGQQKGITPHQQNVLENTYFMASGKSHEAANVTFANTAQAIRSWLASTQLGGAILGSAPDFAFLKSTAAFNGLDFTKVMSHYLPEIAGDKRQAMQLGMIVETGIRGLRDHFDETLSANIGKPGTPMTFGEGMEAASAGAARIAGQASEFVMRGTGLENHSAAGRNAFGKAMLAQLADDTGTAFEALNPRRRAFLERYGIDSGGWDILREKAMHDEGLFMDPAWLAFNGKAAEREPALRLLGAIDAETKFAIPEGGIATRQFLLGNSRPGTVSGEFLRSMQYKGFTLSVSMLHGWRSIDNLFSRDGVMPRGQYLASLAIEATLLGALSYQVKNIAAGKDPERMDTAAFWGKAAAMGGAGGMLGDQIKTFMQTQSMDDASRLVTPTAGLFLNTAALTGGNLAQMIHGDKTNAGREAANFARKYAAPRLWYTSLAVDRLAWDTLQRMMDPDAAGAFYRIEQRARKDTGTSFWWRPGQTEPGRAPNLEAALP